MTSRANIPFAPGLYHNDVDDDCTTVALFNSARAAMWIKNGCDLYIDPDKALAFFRASSHYSGADIAKDPGAQPQAVINYARTHGVDIGWPEPLALASAIPMVDRGTIAAAVEGSGSAYVELKLSVGDWGITENCNHQVFFWDFDGTDDVDLVTVGYVGPMGICAVGLADAAHHRRVVAHMAVAQVGRCVTWRIITNPAGPYKIQDDATGRVIRIPRRFGGHPYGFFHYWKVANGLAQQLSGDNPHIFKPRRRGLFCRLFRKRDDE